MPRIISKPKVIERCGECPHLMFNRQEDRYQCQEIFVQGVADPESYLFSPEVINEEICPLEEYNG